MKTIQALLLREKQDILQSLAEMNQLIPEGHDVMDEIDMSVEEQEYGLLTLLGSQEQEKLLEINDALKRFDLGIYGICEECGEKIKKKRLEALPFARLCLNCQQSEERLYGKGKRSSVKGYSYFEEDEK